MGMARLGLGLALLALAACGAPAPSPPASVAPVLLASASAAPAPEAGVIAPCAPGSPAHRAAVAELSAVDARIAALPLAGKPDQAWRELRELLDGPCVRPPSWEIPEEAPDSSLALQTFWREGGRAWAQHFLDLGAPPSPGNARRAFFPPDLRRTLSLETLPDHPLAGAFLCSLADPACGAEAAAILDRVDQEFAASAPERRWVHFSCDFDPWSRPADVAAACRQRARSARPARRYEAWRACMELEGRPRGLAFPLARLRLPASGWLIVRGRRVGDGDFCDELRAYDLSTGAAYVSQSCAPEDAFNEGPSDPRRTPRVAAGRLALGPLREAALLLMLEQEMIWAGKARAASFPIPEELSPTRPEREQKLSACGSGSSGSSKRTSQEWRLAQGSPAALTGSFQWNPDDPQLFHLRVQAAEATFQPGCPPAALPRELDFGEPKQRWSGVKLGEVTLRALDDALLTGLARLRQGRVCPEGGPGQR